MRQRCKGKNRCNHPKTVKQFLVDGLAINHLFSTEKDNASIKHEIEEIKIVSDEVTRAKVMDIKPFWFIWDLLVLL